MSAVAYEFVQVGSVLLRHPREEIVHRRLPQVAVAKQHTVSVGGKRLRNIDGGSGLSFILSGACHHKGFDSLGASEAFDLNCHFTEALGKIIVNGAVSDCKPSVFGSNAVTDVFNNAKQPRSQLVFDILRIFDGIS